MERTATDAAEPRLNRRRSVAAATAILAVRGYQRVLAPLLGGQCRFSPSCSAYSIEAFERHGAVRGFLLTLRRLFRCHPWGGCGDDPVPPR
jgi:putative membrane protein insertion efficiency factor